jgi:hypothetical protein
VRDHGVAEWLAIDAPAGVAGKNDALRREAGAAGGRRLNAQRRGASYGRIEQLVRITVSALS